MYRAVNTLQNYVRTHVAYTSLPIAYKPLSTKISFYFQSQSDLTCGYNTPVFIRSLQIHVCQFSQKTIIRWTSSANCDMHATSWHLNVRSILQCRPSRTWLA